MTLYGENVIQSLVCQPVSDCRWTRIVERKTKACLKHWRIDRHFVKVHRLCFLQNTVARSLDVLVEDDLSDGTVADEAGTRVLDGRDVPFDRGLD